jgi:hypothetical protein
MSKQLAISSAFACFAMAAMTLAYTPSGYASSDGNLGDYGLQAGQAMPDLPSVPFFSN